MEKLLGEMGRVVLNTLAIYVSLTIGLSLLGHRQTSELSIVELVIVMVMGSAVETAMVNGNTSLPAGLISAGTLLVCNRLMSLLLERYGWLREVVVGRPILLVTRGKLLPGRVRSAGLTEADVLEGIRERGYDDLSQVRLAVLEIDGTISVVPQDAQEEQPQPHHPEAKNE